MQENGGTGLQGRVLVLNQSYEPLTICSPKKALVLLYLTKAELIAENKSRAVHTVTKNFDFPSIIKLSEYKRIPYRQVEISRKNIFRRDGHRCQYCGTKSSPMTIDHVVPKSKGGKDTWENLVTACFKCNNRKGDVSPAEAGLKLRSDPSKPNFILYLHQKLGNIDDNWKPFIFC